MKSRTLLIGLSLAAALACVVSSGRAQVVLTPGIDYSFPNFAYSPPMRKFVDRLPGLTPSGANGLGQYIPIAVANTPYTNLPANYAGSHYYEIGLVDYTEQMHSDLKNPTSGAPVKTKLRGYVQLVPATYPGAVPLTTANGLTRNLSDPVTGAQLYGADKPHYLGPLILAVRDVPVRIKFSNLLGTGPDGDLFLPVDTTLMGAGNGPVQTNIDTVTGQPQYEKYTQNRATIHLHGGLPPWVSDGTALQWITPAKEKTSYTNGASFQNVPDMPVPPNGSATFYFPNQQSGRLMFYHDHAVGITRFVYAGIAAGYLLVDPAEEDLLAAAGVPGTLGSTPANVDLAHLIPLILQDKTFVPDTATLAATDPLWNTAKWGGFGNLWFPHVYQPNQNPFDLTGANPLGRWDYGPWFWPPWPVPAGSTPPLISHVPESFLDTPVVNGTAYPYMDVQPTKYRLRILNACNDRMLNLQLYVADPAGYAINGAGTAVAPGTGFGTEVAMVTAQPNAAIPFPPMWLTQTPGMVPDILDGRQGGVPNPAYIGPAMIQIGTEGGLLPNPVIISNTPVGYEQNKRNIVVLNVAEKSLLIGPAERADIIIDFSKFAGKTVILYNDAPAPVPAPDPRYDFYTGDLDYSATAGANNQGGSPSTLPGRGPNTRTILQFRVASGPDSSAPPDDYDPALLAALEDPNTGLPAAFRAFQPPPIVPQSAYDTLGLGNAPDTYARIQANSLAYTPYGSAAPVTMSLLPKAIQELFDPLGRMNATLGVELPFTSAFVQTTIPLGFSDPATEILSEGETQLWKITHNGVDTHPIHFHLVNVQVINRVGWDGAIRPPDPNELGWKETVRMNPLEDIIVAMRATTPKVPFGCPQSIRPLNPSVPLGSMLGFEQIDPATGNPRAVSNVVANLDWEYTWHCHILGHEENDMMRPIIAHVPTVRPTAPTLTAGAAGTQVNLSWTDPTPAATSLGNPANEIGFRVERAIVNTNGQTGTYTRILSIPANQTTTTDTNVVSPTTYRYRVVIFNASGNATSAPVSVAVTVSAPPAITTQPASQTALVGNTVNFSVVATGSAPLSYAWYFNNARLSNVGGISGASTAALRLSNVQLTQAGNYTVVVSNTVGSVTSVVATLTVGAPPAITTQPVNRTVVPGTTATFSVVATGTAPLSYRWTMNGATVANATGQGTATLTLTNVQLAQAGGYAVVITNAYGSVISATAVLTVNVAPAITTQPASQSALVGSNVVFTVVATGTAPLSYQWRLNGVALANSAGISGATTATLTLSSIAANQAGTYSVVVTNLAGSATSANATLTVSAAPTAPAITTQPQSQTVTAGSNVVFTVAATGTAPLSYQWRLNGVALANNAGISGVTTATLNLASVTTNQGGTYTVVITNTAGTITSAGAVLTVNAPAPTGSASFVTSVTTMGTLRNDVSGFVGMKLTVGASPVTVTAVGRWVHTGNSRTHVVKLVTMAGTDVPGGAGTVATAGTPAGQFAYATLAAPVVLSANTSYYLVSGESINLDTWANSNTRLAVQAVATCDGPVYQWSGAWYPSAAPNQSYVPVDFRWQSGAVPPPANTAPSITTQPVNQNVLAGANASFSVVASGTAPLSYQWRWNGTPLANSASVSGATTATLNLTGVLASQAGNYSVVVTNVAGTATSVTVVLTVSAASTPPAITTQPASQSVTAGANVGFSVLASGTAPLSYQWRRNGVALTDGGGITGSATANLNLANVQTNQAGTYSVVITNLAGMATSTGAALTVSPAAPAGDAPYVTSVTMGTLRNDVSGWVGMKITVGASPVTVTSVGRWVHSGNAQNHVVKFVTMAGTDVPGTAATISTLGATAGQFKYTTLAAPVVLAANTSYYLASQEQSGQDLWANSTTKITAATVATCTGPVYEWSGTWYPSAVANQSYVPVDFRWQSGSVPPPAATAPAITTQPANQAVTAGSTANFGVAATGTAPLSYQWRLNGAALANSATVSGATSANLTLSNVQAAQAGTYSVVITNSAGSVTSANATLTVNAASPAGTATSFVTAVSTMGTFRSDVSGFVGMKITIGATPLTVTAVGRWVHTGNSRTHVVKFVTMANTDVPGASATVATAGAAAGQFAYATLAAPVVLAANTSYYLVSGEAINQDTWANFNTSITVQPGATCNGPVYEWSGTYYPSVLPNQTYVPVDFRKQ